ALSHTLARHTHSPLVAFNAPPPTPTHPLSLHDALPIFLAAVTGTPFALVIILGIAARASLALPIEPKANWVFRMTECDAIRGDRSEEHTSELQSRFDLVCRLLLEKKNRRTVNCGCRRQA